MVIGAAARGDEDAALQRRLQGTQDQVIRSDDAEAGYEPNADTRGGEGAGHAEVTGLRDDAGLEAGRAARAADELTAGGRGGRDDPVVLRELHQLKGAWPL